MKPRRVVLLVLASIIAVIGFGPLTAGASVGWAYGAAGSTGLHADDQPAPLGPARHRAGPGLHGRVRTKLLKIGAAVVRRPAAGLVHTTGPSRLNLGPASNREGTGAAGGQHGEEHPLRHIAMALRLPQHQCQAPNGEQPGRDCRKHRQNPPIRGR